MADAAAAAPILSKGTVHIGGFRSEAREQGEGDTCGYKGLYNKRVIINMQAYHALSPGGFFSPFYVNIFCMLVFIRDKKDLELRQDRITRKRENCQLISTLNFCLVGILIFRDKTDLFVFCFSNRLNSNFLLNGSHVLNRYIFYSLKIAGTSCPAPPPPPPPPQHRYQPSFFPNT